MIKKIISLNQIAKVLRKRDKKKISLCHGVFDLLHPGHINHFNQAKKISDILIVSVTSDKKVLKGPGRPHFDERSRMMSIASLQSVDYVVLSNNFSSVDIIEKIKPNYYVKGSDYKNFQHDITKKISKENLAVKKNGGKIIFTDGITFSSSEIINQKFIYNSDQYNFIKKLKTKYSSKFIIKSLKLMRKNTPLVLGESIIDEYVFCHAIGKSGKEPYMVLQEKKSEEYLGGVLSIAQNISALSKKVNLLSSIGYEKKIQNNVYGSLKRKNIKFKFLKKKTSSILKKRFIEQINNTKLLGVYTVDDNEIKNNEKKKLISMFKNFIKDSDFIILSDYGHNFFNKELVQEIYKSKKFLAVNAQVNSFTSGYNTITNYKKVDIALMNETELRQELRDKTSNRLDLIKKLDKKINASYIAITHGKTGATIYEKKYKKIIHVPAFANNVIDKVGAGDALFPILASSIYSGIPTDISLYFASLSAAINSENYGNKFVLDNTYFTKTVEHSLK